MATIESSSSIGAKTRSVIDVFDRYVVPNYKRYPVCLVRGEGSKVWDAEGAEYLDLFPGWGCNLLGHCPEHVVRAVQEQVAKLIHVPNTWYIEPQGEWARLLSERSFGGQAFFCNSGTEANEAAIKLVRLRSDGTRYKIITFRGGFHGRTMGSVTATAQPKYHEGLGPMLAGFQYAPHGDLEAVERLIDEHTGGIMVEPILGEGGVVPAPPGFLQGLRRIADERDLLLVFDEVQCGCGRTGAWFGYQHFDVTPDVMTLAKTHCAGVAGGAMLTTVELAKHLRPGMHASTFGGNPIAAAAGIAAIEMIERDNLLSHVGTVAAVFRERLGQLRERCDVVTDVRVLGMMI
ncbi:MAG: aspartate aminotransferase family protein, partial [Planctomycetia bacterium]